MKTIFKRILPRLLFALILLVSAGMNRDSGLRAQDTIGFSQSGWSGMPASIYAGDTAIAGAFVINVSDSAYPLQDSIQIVGYIDTFNLTNYNYFITPPMDSVTGLTPGDSSFFIEQIIFKDNFQGGQFRIGSNVIVVWPIMYNPNFRTGDSLFVTVLVIDTINSTGREYNPNYDVHCYPVPSSGPLYITSTCRTAKPVNVTVYDSSGKLICVSSSLTSGINTDAWVPGIYLLEVLFDDNSKSSIKIIRQ